MLLQNLGCSGYYVQEKRQTNLLGADAIRVIADASVGISSNHVVKLLAPATVTFGSCYDPSL